MTEHDGSAMRLAGALVLAMFVVGCAEFGRLTPAPVVWGDSVPEAAPEAIAAQPVVARTSNSITLLPISPTGAVIGTDYAYALPHCGIRSPIDVDGSFWDAVDLPPDPVQFDGLPGTFRLTSPNNATFTAPDGSVLHLARHGGAKQFGFCA